MVSSTAVVCWLFILNSDHDKQVTGLTRGGSSFCLTVVWASVTFCPVLHTVWDLKRTVPFRSRFDRQLLLALWWHLWISPIGHTLPPMSASGGSIRGDLYTSLLVWFLHSFSASRFVPCSFYFPVFHVSSAGSLFAASCLFVSCCLSFSPLCCCQNCAPFPISSLMILTVERSIMVSSINPSLPFLLSVSMTLRQYGICSPPGYKSTFILRSMHSWEHRELHVPLKGGIPRGHKHTQRCSWEIRYRHVLY